MDDYPKYIPDDYPPDWPEISRAAKSQANWACRNCGAKHDPETGYTLTVHHLNGIKSDCRPENLLVCCQRCHLHIQARYIPGQQFLPGMAPGWLP